MFSKRTPWLLCLLGACCSLLPLTPARAVSSGSTGQIDVNFFYDTLKDEGSWFNTTDYGDVWQPYIAYKSDSWRPYTDGYWSYTDGGWMFVSNESFGWAVYHYGRWTKLQDIGWAWVPGTEWAPAWVTWRESKPADASGAPAAAAVSATTTDAPDTKDTPPPPPPPAADNNSSGSAPAPAPGNSENYIGWAPLPPTPIAYGTGYAYGPGVDVEIGVDPYAYVFTDYRSFGDPWLAGVIFDSDRGYYCCGHSVNITNVYYNNRGGYRGFYNGGPDYNRLRGATARPIQQLAIQRNTNSALVRQQVRNGTFNNIHGNQINVAAPRFSQNSVRDGRINFSRRGTLPVTPVAKQFAPAAAAENPSYKQARESFARQGEAYRAQTPTGQGARPGAPAIATTARAQQEERQARQQAEHQGRPEGAASPEAAPRREGQATANAGQREAVRQSHQESRRTRNGGGGGAGRAERQERRSAAPRVERTAPRVERGGGGGERHGGGGGERRGGGGGGGEKKKK